MTAVHHELGDAPASRRHHRERGSVFMITALLLPILLIGTSMAVDLGRVRSARRDLQSVADAVALDMIRSLSTPLPGTWNASITASRNRNSFASNGTETDGIKDLSVTPGCYTAASDSFVPVGAGCTIATAVRVLAGDTIPYSFNPLSGSKNKFTNRESIANLGATKQAESLLGSSVAAIDPVSDTIIGQLLNSIMPGASLISYAGLVNSNITLGQLGAYLPITAGSPDELLNTSFTMNQIALAAARALQDNGASAAQVSALNQLANLAVAPSNIRLGDALDSQIGGNPGSSTVINIQQLLVGSVLAVDGDHLLDINLGGTLPGISKVKVNLQGIEAPRRIGIEDGASNTTKQTSITVTPTIDASLSNLTQNICSLPVSERNLLASLVGGLLNVVTCLLGGVLNQVIDLHVTATPSLGVSLAAVKGTNSIDCVNKKLTVSLDPSVLTLTNQLSLNITGTLLGTSLGNLANVTTASNAHATGTSGALSFLASGAGPEYTTWSPTSGSTGSNPLGLASLIGTANPSTSLTVANVNLSQLGTAVTNLLASGASPLNTLLGQLDTKVLQPLAQLLGLSLGGSKVTPLWMKCDQNMVQLAR